VTQYVIEDARWRVLVETISLPADLASIMDLIMSGRASPLNVNLTLQRLEAKAEMLAAFCRGVRKEMKNNE
jgi:hypothetical protein